MPIILQTLGKGGTVVSTGVGLGCVIAVICSWNRNRSILWAIVAGLLSWVYVIYFAITRSEERAETQSAIPRFPIGVKRDRPLK